MPSKSVYAIPCDHPAARDGVFHCVPSFYNAAHMRADYVFILADTQKTIRQLRHDDPKMLEHAENKFSGSTAQQWLETTSFEYPQNMGHWVYSPERGLSMSSGEAALIKLVQEIHIPCFPIAVEKAWGERAINELRSKIEYVGPFRPSQLIVHKAMDLDY